MKYELLVNGFKYLAVGLVFCSLALGVWVQLTVTATAAFSKVILFYVLCE